MTTTDKIAKILYETMPLVRREQVMHAAGEIEKIFPGHMIGFNFNDPSSIQMHVHPATCDCSGGDQCERLNKTGEGEMKCKNGDFVCPCGLYVQHKCISQNDTNSTREKIW